MGNSSLTIEYRLEVAENLLIKRKRAFGGFLGVNGR